MVFKDMVPIFLLKGGKMEQLIGTLPYQCQAPQYNAVKIDIHQPKVQAPKAHCHDGECCKGKHNLYGKKNANSATMPLPSNVIVAKQEKPVEKPQVEQQKPVVAEETQVSEQKPVVAEKTQVNEQKPVVAEETQVNKQEPVVVEEPIE